MSGIGWSLQTHAAGSFKGLALLSPRHFLTAQHYEAANSSDATTGMRILDAQGRVLAVQGVRQIVNLGQGLVFQSTPDLALGVLSGQFADPAAIARPGVLDLHGSNGTNSLSNYNGLPVLHYGRSNTTNGSPRVAATTVNATFTNGSDPRAVLIRTSRSVVQLEAGDSAAPLLARWQNPEGAAEPILLGVNSAVDANFNYISMLATAGGINAANNAMNPDGFALRVVGNSQATWSGGSSGSATQRTALSRSANWTSNATTDTYVSFNAASTSIRSPVVDANANLRGIYFRSTTAQGDGFSLGGNFTLTIGRGGLTNYDNDPQTISAPISLQSSQFWNAGTGGVRIHNLITSDKLLEIRSPGPSEITGVISGTGAVALESGQLLLSGNSSFSGRTWVHSGSLRVTGSIAGSQEIVLGESAVVSGHGSLPLILGSGTVSPGNPGAPSAILRAPLIDPAGGLDFIFGFSAPDPDFAQPSNAGNDVIRLDSGTPFASALQSHNRVHIFLERAQPAVGEAFRGGFFTHQPSDFLASLGSAQFTFFVPDPEGAHFHEGQPYKIYDASRPLKITTVPHTAALAGGAVTGRILQVTVLPDPNAYEGWMESSFPSDVPPELRAPDADANGDGVTNLLAYALGVSPLSSATNLLPPPIVAPVSATPPAGGEGGMQAPQNELVFRFYRNPSARDLVYEVEVSSNLTQWTTWQGTPQVIEADPRGDGSVELVEARLQIEDPAGRLFARLRVALQGVDP